jgi:phosphoribosylformylglycinamidine synthase
MFAAMHSGIRGGLVRACHDLSEGGLAVAAAEMAFAGGLGARIDLDALATGAASKEPVIRLFSESNTRFLCEVPAERASEFERILANVRLARIGDVAAEPRLILSAGGRVLVDAEVAQLKEAWQATFRW